jgi:predicted metal-dependent phosphoesterase TrpH/Fe2+ or Zn2+ uptake regulation protein/rubrerythrin
MQSTSAYVDSLRPAGSKRSSKRDFIVNVFLRQEGHLSADDLVEIIRREDTRISRATIYRTLQWMVDAGIARKVDFGEGRFRFEHSYRHPRHFHLICKTCNKSSEFLSSDIEALVEEIAAARNFAARQSVVQIYGTCEECRTGRAPASAEGATELLFARDALRIAIATERSGRDFYARAARITRDARARSIFLKLSEEEVGHLDRLEGRYRELLAQDPELESRPTFLFFKGAANGLFSEGAEALSKVTTDREALMIGIRCERGSHRSFKKYGERFEDSEGKQIFLEFAARASRAARASDRRSPGQRVIDLHVHSTASDGALDPASLAAHLAGAGITTFSLTDHDTMAGTAEAARAAARHGLGFIPGIEVTAVHEGRDVHLLGYGLDASASGLEAFLQRQRTHRVTRVREIAARLAALGCAVDVEPVIEDAARQRGRAIGRPHLARALVAAGHVDSVQHAFDTWLASGRPAFVPRTGVSPRTGIAAIRAAGGVAGLAHPGVTKCEALVPSLVADGLQALEVWHSDHDATASARYLAMAAAFGLLATGGSDFHGPAAGRVCRLGEVGLPADRFAQLTERIDTCRSSS